MSPKLQLNKYETALNFVQLSQNLTLDCLLIQLNFPVLHQILHNVIIKMFYRSKQNNFMITSFKNWGIQGNSAKSTNNPMSSFGSIEENMELSHIIQLYSCKYGNYPIFLVTLKYLSEFFEYLERQNRPKQRLFMHIYSVW